MKKTLTTMLALILLMINVLEAQTNLDFESWNGNEPNGWQSSNTITTAAGGDQTVFRETTNPSEGNTSLKLVTGSCPDCPNFAPLGPFLTLPLPDPMGGVVQLGSYLTPGIPYTDRPISVDFDYKAMPMPNDYGIFYVELLDYDPIADTSEVIGEATFDIGSQVPNWTHVSIPFIYHSTKMPNRIDIFASSSVGSFPDFSALFPNPIPMVFPDPVAGSTLWIDDIQFTLPSCLGFSLNLTGANESAPAACDGSVTANPAGGTPPYTYLWDSGQTSSSVNGLCPGIYEVVVTDANGCFEIKTYTVLQGSCGSFATTLSSTNTTSPSAEDGSVSVNVTGGTPPYTIDFSTGVTQTTSAATTTFNNLGFGLYGVQVVDNSGFCVHQKFITVWGPGGSPTPVFDIEQEADLVSIYPNPSDGVFSIEMEEEIENIMIYNQLGKEIFYSRVNSNLLSVDLTNQAAGIYFYKISSKKGLSTGKVVIQ